MKQSVELLLRAVHAHPCKGDSNVLRELEIRRDEHPLLAVLDDDRIRERLKLPLSADAKQVVAAVHLMHPNARVMLLIKNMEDLIAAACRVLKRARERRE